MWAWVRDPMALTLCIWITGFNVVVAFVINCRNWFRTNKRVRALEAQVKEVASLKYRMDIFEGKHLKARNLGFGLPQPRPKDNNGD